MFAGFIYVCSLEDAVCSETEDENSIEHGRLPQCDAEQKHILRKYRGSKEFRYQDHTILTCIKVMNNVCSYLLSERESVLLMEPQYKIRKLAGCVNVNQIFHNIKGYKDHQLVILLQG
jgi:hypothetical protein